MHRILLAGLSLAGLCAGAAPAFAHLDPGEHGSFLAGVTHPLFGLDHVLAMVAVGLWAVLLEHFRAKREPVRRPEMRLSKQIGRAVWTVPSAFVGTMAAGFGLASAGVALPFVEPAILASVVVLGLAVAAAVRLPVAAGAVLVGAFALFHGHAHGAELGAAAALPYLCGFAVATAALHGAGIGLGLLLASGLRHGPAIARALGGAMALAGVSLIVGIF